MTSVSCTFRSQVSSPSIATSSANRQLMMLEGKSGPYFSSLDSSIDILKKRAQDLIENINESRQKDHALMTNFRDSLKIKVTDSPTHCKAPICRERESYVKGERGGNELLLLSELHIVPHDRARMRNEGPSCTHSPASPLISCQC